MVKPEFSAPVGTDMSCSRPSLAAEPTNLSTPLLICWQYQSLTEGTASQFLQVRELRWPQIQKSICQLGFHQSELEFLWVFVPLELPTSVRTSLCRGNW